MSEISFEIPKTPENVRAMEQLKQLFFDAPCTPCTLYAEDKDGNLFPVANISKHPDCPDGWYEKIIQRFTNL